MVESTTARKRVGRRGAGFTIVELMITVAIASILLAIAVPSFNQMIVSGRLAAQANELVGALSLARSEAIKRNANVTLCRAGTVDDDDCVDAGGDWQAWIVRANSTGEVVRRGAVNTFGGSMLVQSTLNTDQVVFGADGLARTGGGMVADHTITICSDRIADANVRRIVMGAGSRLSTEIDDGEC